MVSFAAAPTPRCDCAPGEFLFSTSANESIIAGMFFDFLALAVLGGLFVFRAKFRLSFMLWVSFILAGFAGLSAILFYSTLNDWTNNMLALSAYVLGPAWLAFALSTVRRYGKRGLWVLLGLPFALSCTGLLALLVWACATGRGCP